VWVGKELTRLPVSLLYERNTWYSGTMGKWLFVDPIRADMPAGQSGIRDVRIWYSGIMGFSSYFSLQP
jgi:hypothetical protein